jgi:hypothetical protein
MSTLKVNNVQIGQSSTATQNFVLSIPVTPDGTIKLSRGNMGVTTQDVLTIDATGAVAFPATAAIGQLGVVTVTGTTQTAVAGSHYILTNVATTTVTLPASPASGDTVWVTPTNGLTTNVIARNGQTIMGLAEDVTVDNANATVELRFVNGNWRLV